MKLLQPGELVREAEKKEAVKMVVEVEEGRERGSSILLMKSCLVF